MNILHFAAYTYMKFSTGTTYLPIRMTPLVLNPLEVIKYFDFYSTDDDFKEQR